MLPCGKKKTKKRKKKMKTNKELNQDYDRRQSEKIRPKGPDYNWKPLEEVVRKWVEASKNRE